MCSIGFFPRRTGWYALTFSLLAFAVSGCGQKAGTVSGKVLYQGKPLPGGFVNFMSEADKGVAKTSTIKEDGSYSVSGLPAGTTKISVQGLKARRLAELPGQGAKDEKAQQKEVFVPDKYSNTDTSGLKFEVKSGSQSYDIELK